MIVVFVIYPLVAVGFCSGVVYIGYKYPIVGKICDRVLHPMRFRK